MSTFTMAVPDHMHEYLLLNKGTREYLVIFQQEKDQRLMIQHKHDPDLEQPP